MNDINSAAEQFFKGLHALNIRDFPNAEKHFLEALRIVPDRPSVLTNLSVVYAEQGRLTEALALAETAVRQDTANPFFLLQLGSLQLKLELPGEALQTIEAVLQMDDTIPQAYNSRGGALKNLKRLDEALASHDKAISLKPDYAEAYSNRGMVLKELKRLDEALASQEKAISLRPDYAEAHSNRGIVLKELKRLDEALASHDKAIGIKPDFARAYIARAAVLEEQEQFAAALASYDKAVTYESSRIASALAARGDFLTRVRRYEAALKDFESAIERDHADEDLYLGKALCLSKLNRHDECRATLALAREKLSTSEIFNYHAAGLAGDSTVPRPPSEYVIGLFDSYAARFEEHLVGRLAYATPDKMFRQFSRSFPPSRRTCLDLGCGTGLCGIAYRDCIASAIGVDLSQGMLDEARTKNFYDELICSDVIEYVGTTDHRFDLVMSIDVLVYIGELEPLFAGVKRVLTREGIFAFSTEVSETRDYELKPSARYGHSRSYIERLAAQHDFKVVVLERDVIRQESGSALEGYLVHLVSA